MNITRKIALSLALCSLPAVASASVVINEIMQSNIDCIMDDLNDFPDSWVELYNTGTSAVEINGYKISLTNKPEDGYTLPSATIQAGGHLLIYCDKAETGLHTDFRLESGKGAVYLYDASGNQVDALEGIKKQPGPNIAYGRESDADSKWGYELTPTPGAANAGGLSKTILDPVVFGTEGFVTNTKTPFRLELSLPETAPAGSYIVYTTDGREPYAGRTAVYQSPINVYQGMTVRAKVVCDGCISPWSTAQTYIFLERDMKIPVINISTDTKYLYDAKIGIFADGSGGEGNENYRQNWRRPIMVEFFDQQDKPAVINQLAETRVQGAWTRSNPLKSLTIYANKRFGTKRLNYEFWPKDKPGVSDNKSLILRNGGNDFCWTYIRDGLIQRVIGRNSDHVDWQGYAPAIVCINGQYHGMLAMRERSSEDNIYSNYNGLEDIDMFENWWEIKSGDWVERDDLDRMIANPNLTYNDWAAKMDLESYIDLMAINFWVYNTDFPNNNTVFWRRRSGDDTRWRWLVKDTDFGLGIWNSWDNINANFADHMKGNSDNNTGHTLWKRLMAIPEFKEKFADHLIAYCGDFLHKDVFLEYLDEIMEENAGEQLISHLKWRKVIWWDWSDLNSNLDHMRNWIKQRHNNIPGLIRNTFGLSTPVSVLVNTQMDREAAKALGITYNGVPLRTGSFQGSDFYGRTITLDAADNSDIVGWKLTEGSTTREIEGRKISVPISGNYVYNFTPIIDNTGVADVASDTQSIHINGDIATAPGRIEVYDMTGRLVATGIDQVELPASGIYIITASGTTVKAARQGGQASSLR